KKTADAVDGGADKTKEATAKAGDKTAAATTKAGDKTKDAVSSADDKGGPAVTDAAITSAVKTKLLGDGKAPGLKIDVDTNDGVVTLTGDVATGGEHLTALRLARD